MRDKLESSILDKYQSALIVDAEEME